VSAGDDRCLRVWDPHTGEPTTDPLTGHTGRVLALTAVPVSPTRALVASCGDDGWIRTWDPATGQPIAANW
jgi:WD40 repeat protein